MSIDRRLSLIGVLYVAALFTPAIFAYRDSYKDFELGLGCLLRIPAVCIYPEWWANPLLFLGCVLLRHRRYAEACWCSLLASVLALNTFLDFGPLVGPGCLFWLASIFALLPAGLAGDGLKVRTREILGEP